MVMLRLDTASRSQSPSKPEVETVSRKCQIVNIIRFASHAVSVTVTHFSHYSKEAAINSMQIDGVVFQ